MYIKNSYVHIIMAAFHKSYEHVTHLILDTIAVLTLNHRNSPFNVSLVFFANAEKISKFAFFESSFRAILTMMKVPRTRKKM